MAVGAVTTASAVTTANSEDEPSHGINSLAEILGFIIGLITTEPEMAQDDMNVLGLELMYTALNAGQTGQPLPPHLPRPARPFIPAQPISVHQDLKTT